MSGNGETKKCHVCDGSGGTGRVPKFHGYSFRSLFAGLATLLVLATAACSAPEEGTIVDKGHTDAYDSVIPLVVSCGNGCTLINMVPFHQDECWQIFLRNGDDTGDRCIGHDEWRHVTKGDYWRLTK